MAKLIASCMHCVTHVLASDGQASLALDLRSFLPSFPTINMARQSDPTGARQIGTGSPDGEFAIPVKSHFDFGHLWDLALRGIARATRARQHLQFDRIAAIFPHTFRLTLPE